MIQKPSYIHYRRRDNHTGEVSDPRGGATVAFQLSDNGTAKLAYAFCNNKEVFNRKLGRVISTGRLEADRPGSFVNQIAVDTDGNVRDQVCSSVASKMESMGYE
jgi:hypothetical protein